MYNLLVTAEAGAWDKQGSVLDLSRYLEHTDDNLREHLRALDDKVVAELTKLPTLFAYETQVNAPARVGWIVDVRRRQNKLRIGHRFDSEIEPLAPDKIESLKWELHIADSELSRTHWAVKAADLLAVLTGRPKDAGIVPPYRKTPDHRPETLRRLDRLIADGQSVLDGYREIGNIDRYDSWRTAIRSFLTVNVPTLVPTLDAIPKEILDGLWEHPYGRPAYNLTLHQLEVLRLARDHFTEEREQQLDLSGGSPADPSNPLGRGGSVEVLIITAADGEDEAVRQVGDPGLWRKVDGPKGFPLDVWRADLPMETGAGVLRVALVKAFSMGAEAAGHAAATLTQYFQPGCLAMCGVCAGRPGWTNLGDVIIADRVYRYDVGDLVNATPGAVPRFNGDLMTFPFRASWKQPAEKFTVPADATWLAQRPLTRDLQSEWVLRELHGDRNPSSSPERAVRCPDWKDVAQLLQRDGLVEIDGDGSPGLTAAGRKRVGQLMFEHADGIPAPPGFRIHVGPLGTGSSLIRDVDIWERLAADQRLLRGFDMEASVIGLSGFLHEVPWIVAKGVMDFAEPGRTQGFRRFAARAAAEVLIQFIAKHLDPVSTGTLATDNNAEALAVGETGTRNIVREFSETAIKETMRSMANARSRSQAYRERLRSIVEQLPECEKKLIGLHLELGFRDTPIISERIGRAFREYVTPLGSSLGASVGGPHVGEVLREGALFSAEVEAYCAGVPDRVLVAVKLRERSDSRR